MPALPHPDVVAAARDGEPERYLAALLAPADMRADLLAVAAFTAEMRRIPHLVKEPMMGEVRLQWWRETIDGFDHRAPSGHAIADALGAATRHHCLPKLVLVAMTEARAFDLYDDPMADDAAFRGYLNKTEAAPFALALQILKAEVPATLADTAGQAFGMTRILSLLPKSLAKGRLPLPLSLLQQTNTSVDDLLHGHTTTEAQALFAHIIRDIEAAAAAARAQSRELSKAQRTALLPLAMIPAYLRVLRRNKSEVLQTIVEPLPFARAWRIARSHWLGL